MGAVEVILLIILAMAVVGGVMAALGFRDDKENDQ